MDEDVPKQKPQSPKTARRSLSPEHKPGSPKTDRRSFSPEQKPKFDKKISGSGHAAAKANAKQKKQKLIDKRNKLNGFDEVLVCDIDKLLKSNESKQAEVNVDSGPLVLPETFTELDVKISVISSTGDGLALAENGKHVYVVPFTVPGDVARVKVIKHFKPLSYSLTDFIKVVEPGPQRNDANIGCKYFGQCSGCQLQMMSYEDQLAHKRRVVEKAYANFSGLIPELVPAVEPTFASPKQYGYRTKLTPHFEINLKGPKGVPRAPQVPPIGYTYKNQRKEIDIEDCPLGTDIVRRGLKSERKRVAENIESYKRGATLLMRESTTRIPKDDTKRKSMIGEMARARETGDVIRIEHETYTEEKRCVTDNNAISYEYVDDYLFTNKAGAFFQNNNSILSGFTEYIRSKAIPANNDQDAKPIKYLLDAYSGSGLFTITLSPLFKSSLGVDIGSDSIISARQNVVENNIKNTGFAAADATTLFKDVPYPPDQTLLVIDPPRKGCSDDFLRQLLEYKPRRVVYVSCNVHTQARDVAVMVQGNEKNNVRYEIESIRGFDFFPQTGHVEGVAILNRASFPKEDKA
ncbi:(Uracil-5)-methyltransferase [Penicillium sp. DV-2018c]|nr:(Uracil-5)-methyltransferase [Penicillium sp. DV-2018c]KAJ5561224.1 (Uracil-5)-methyltransferase [Penicillium sp. DV-2018c]KAJ5563748.1 (Uracil-5)-methyltransferase [Penicillium sp. DV-2018c]